jgi:hypothetical protein
MILSSFVLDSNFLSQIQRYILFQRYHIVGNGEDGCKIFWRFGGVLRFYVQGVYSQMGLKGALLIWLLIVIILVA